jgi:hypothetical protein
MTIIRMYFRRRAALFVSGTTRCVVHCLATRGFTNDKGKN